MSANSYDELREHVGHKIVCVAYTGPGDSDPANVAVECETCSEVITDFDHPNNDYQVFTNPPANDVCDDFTRDELADGMAFGQE